MKTIEKIKKAIQKPILVLAAISFPVICGSAQIGNQKHEPFVISTIIPLNMMDYTASLKVNSYLTENSYEAEPTLENWMVDSGNWNSLKAGYGFLMSEVTEAPLEVESWMLENYGYDVKTNMSNETIKEEKATIENWMLHPETWGK